MKKVLLPLASIIFIAIGVPVMYVGSLLYTKWEGLWDNHKVWFVIVSIVFLPVLIFPLFFWWLGGKWEKFEGK